MRERRKKEIKKHKGEQFAISHDKSTQSWHLSIRGLGDISSNEHSFIPNVISSFYFQGILSILLIISIVELSISVSVASLRAKCWMRSNEVSLMLV